MRVFAEGGTASDPETATPATASNNKVVASALGFLRDYRRWASKGSLDASLVSVIAALDKSVSAGTFSHLEREVSDLAKAWRKIAAPDESQGKAISGRLSSLYGKYCARTSQKEGANLSSGGAFDSPSLIVSETFITRP